MYRVPFKIVSIVSLLMLTLVRITACTPPAIEPPSIQKPISKLTDTPPPTSIPTLTADPSAAPDPYWKYTIDYLHSRSYGGGKLKVIETNATNSAFTRYLIRYPSDDLMNQGFMNVPNGEGNFPVIIALHGYIDPAIYNTFDYTTHYADALASAGYLVLHPNLRDYPPSDTGDNLFNVGMAIDVLNLIAIVKSTGGQPGPLQTADPGRIGMWGHSMGGGVTTRVLTISRDVKAAVLYAAVGGDEARNYATASLWSKHDTGSEERAVPALELPRISPSYYFSSITASVSIHHSLTDPIVPVQWSMQTCEQLKALNKDVECHYYEKMPHTFERQGDKVFIQYTIQFFDRILKAP
jgi:dipeptidyl aminopeptidase/acylaminoacyl peptidase